MAVWESSCRKRAHADMAAATPASDSAPAPALLFVQPGSMHPLAGAAQTTAVPLLQQQEQQQQQRQEQHRQELHQHQEQQELGRPLQTPAENPVAPQLQQPDRGQRGTPLQQQPKLPGEHAQAKCQGAKQAYAALQAKHGEKAPQQAQQTQYADSAKQAHTAVPANQAQHACPAKQAHTAVLAKHAQRADPAQQAQRAPDQAQQAPLALPAQRPLQRQHAVQATTKTQQAAQHTKQMLPGQQDGLPRLKQRGQHAAQAQSVKVSQHSEQLHPKRPAPSADINSSVKRHKVSSLTYTILFFSGCVLAGWLAGCSRFSTLAKAGQADTCQHVIATVTFCCSATGRAVYHAACNVLCHGACL